MLFQRTVPGFEPSPESFKISEDNLAEVARLLARYGLGDRAAISSELITEVAEGIHQLSTFVGAPVGFNQYLIAAEEPMLFHTGMRQMFPLVSEGVSKVLPAETLRWVSFGHVEADESGSMNDWLALARHATVVQSQIGCMVSIDDLADRPPRPLGDC